MKNCYIITLVFVIIFFVSICLLSNTKKETFSEGIVGTSFVSRVPQGLISSWFPGNSWDGSSVPSGWTLCDGKGTIKINGVDVTVPDLRSRFILGAGQGNGNDSEGRPLTNRNFNSYGGAETHTLKVNEIPPHTHQYTNIYLAGSYSGGSDTHYNAPGVANTSNGSESGLGGQPHENMPPFFVAVYIIKN